MEIMKTVNGSVLELKIIGNVNSATTPQFADALDDLDSIDQVIIDCSEMDYISSTGLRVLLTTEKTMRANGGEMVLTNVQDEAMEVFEITGFSDLFTIRSA